MLDKIEHAMQSATSWAVATLLGGVLYLIRRVFTNQRQIELLQRDLEDRKQQRQEDRELIKETRESVRRLEGWMIGKRK